jgi:hypothetical protein
MTQENEGDNMTVEDLLALLHDLPVDALKKDIFIDNDKEQFCHVAIEAVTEEDGAIIGYVIVEIVEPDSRQSKLDFN